MTLPLVIRIFFALDLPASLKDSLREVIQALKKSAKSHGVRWTKPENLHITLQFLAEVKTAHLPILIETVKNNLNTLNLQKTIVFENIELFPSPYRPRVIVLNIPVQSELVLLANTIAKGIQVLEYELDKRPFRAHLTIGRIKQPQDLNLSFLSEFKLPALTPFNVEEVVLFRSEPEEGGSKYTVLERLPLGIKTVQKALG